MLIGRWRIILLASLLVVLTPIIATWLGLRNSDSTQNYTPSPAVSEDAVRRALEAWKAGEPAGELPATKPVIFVTDTGRKPHQLLDSYAILGEIHGNAGRSYAVTLNLTNPEEVIKTKYLVVGIDPLWVFREQDYQLLMHWDHHMAKPETTVDDSVVAPK